MPLPVIAIGALAGGFAFRRFAPRALTFIGRRGLRGFRARPIIKATTGALAVGTATTFGAELIARTVARTAERFAGGEPMTQAPVRRSSQAPVRRGTIVTAGPVPVVFVRRWNAGEAQFAIDDQGVRWVWRPRLGIWKRIRNTRNIVISGKDLRRAKRLVAISKRLVKMRQSLR